MSARARVQAAQAALDTAELNLQYTRVTAPVSGRTGRALVTQGNLANADQSLLTTVVSVDPVHVYFEADEQSAFSDLLVRLGVPHEFDAEGDLVVQATDEEAVESALDAFQSGGDERPELEGLEANSLLSEVFVACDRLRRDARDLIGIDRLVDLAPILVGHRPPFGIDGRLWNALGERTTGLVGLLGTGDPDPTAVLDEAHQLSETLRQLT